MLTIGRGEEAEFIEQFNQQPREVCLKICYCILEISTIHHVTKVMTYHLKSKIENMSVSAIMEQRIVRRYVRMHGVCKDAQGM